MFKQQNNRVRLFIVGLAICLHASGLASAAEVTLAWDPPNSSNNVAGYRIHCGTASRIYSAPIDVGHATDCIVANLDPTVTYFFAITVYNSSGNESDFSSELVWDNVAPTISGPETISMTPPLSGTILMPDLRKYLTVDDDVSPLLKTTVSQKPAPGMKLTDVPGWVIFTAVDEAGNQTSRAVPVSRSPQVNETHIESIHPSIGISLLGGAPVISCSIPETAGISYLDHPGTFTLEWCTNLTTRAWLPVPGCEAITPTNQVLIHRPAEAVRTAFFRFRPTQP